MTQTSQWAAEKVVSVQGGGKRPEFRRMGFSLGRFVLSAPKIDDADWLANSHYQSYLVLNLCRILHTVIDGQPGSKKVAGEWAKAMYPQWKSSIEEAERWSYGGTVKRQADAMAFLWFAVEKANETKLRYVATYGVTVIPILFDLTTLAPGSSETGFES